MVRSLWPLAFVALWCLLPFTHAGNCSSTAVVLLKRPFVEYEIRGGEVLVFPTHNGLRSDQTSLRWDLSYIVERNKTVKNVAGNTIQPSCTIPRCDSICDLDPLELAYPDTSCSGSTSGRPCGPLVSHLNYREMDCFVEHVRTDFHGFERESVYVHYSHPLYPNFKTIAANHILNGYLDYYPIPNDTLVVNRYVPDSLKISYDIVGYPWGSQADYEPGFLNFASSLSIWWDSTISVAPGNISANHDDVTRRVLAYKSLDLTTELGIDIASVFVADEKAFVDPDSGSFHNITIDLPVSINITFATNLCNETLGKWSHLEYDPSFNALFNPAIQPQADDSPNPRKSGLSSTQIAVIATVIPLIVLTGAFAIAYKFIRPKFMQKLPK